jgi:hypothetical protein
MLLYLAEYLARFESGFNVFQYLTFRAILGALTALAISLLLGPWMIRKLTFHQIGQQVRSYGPESHLPKAGTPTMGGALILIAIAVATLLWADLGNRFVWIVLLVMLGFGLIGFVDDYKKLVVGDSAGLAARWKYLWQSVGAILAGFAFLYTAVDPAVEQSLIVPFFKNVMLPLGVVGYLVLVYFVIVGSSNAVNLTDGARRAGDHADGADRRRARPVRLGDRQRGVLELPRHPPMCRAPASCWCSARRWPAPGSASCGSTPTRRRSSWATSARWRWVPRWVPWRSLCARRSCSSSWPACSCSRRSR